MKSGQLNAIQRAGRASSFGFLLTPLTIPGGRVIRDGSEARFYSKFRTPER
jgi:hypothetical protein